MNCNMLYNSETFHEKVKKRFSLKEKPRAHATAECHCISQVWILKMWALTFENDCSYMLATELSAVRREGATEDVWV